MYMTFVVERIPYNDIHLTCEMRDGSCASNQGGE